MFNLSLVALILGFAEKTLVAASLSSLPRCGVGLGPCQHCPVEVKTYNYPDGSHLTNWSNWWEHAAIESTKTRLHSWPGSTVFFSFHPHTGGTAARVLGLKYAQLGYSPLYIDDFPLDEISDAVCASDALVLIESNGIMNSTPVLTSLNYAIKEGVPVIPYDLPGFDFGAFGDDCYFLDQKLPLAQIENLTELGADISNLTWYLGSFLPFIISEDFDAAGRRGVGDGNVKENPIRSNFEQLIKNGLQIVQPGMAKEAFFYWREMWQAGKNPRIRPYVRDQRSFATYISHHISTSGAEARLLNMMLFSNFGFGDVFLDVKDFHDTRSDPSNVAQSCTFMLVLDNTTLSRSFCLLETYWALKAGRPVTLVNIAGKGYDHSAATLFLQNLVNESATVLGTGGVQLIHQFGEDLSDMQTVLAANIPFLPLFPFDTTLDSSKMSAQVSDIVDSMGTSAVRQAVVTDSVMV